jgi:transposase
MILDPEEWMNIGRFRALHQTGVSISAIARESEHDWKTVKKYLQAEPSASSPVAPSRKGTQPRKIDYLAGVVDAWLRADITLKASVIHERLVDQYGFTGHYQRVKRYCAQARPQITAELHSADDNPLHGLHHRFEVVAGAQAQVDWGDESGILAHVGIDKVYSFHMVLSYCRDPFCCFVTPGGPGHVLGVPPAGADPLRRCARSDRLRSDQDGDQAARRTGQSGATASAGGGLRRPLRPHTSTCWLPTGPRARAGSSVRWTSSASTLGRSFDSLAELDAAFAAWVPLPRAQVHRTHGEVIAVRAQRDRSALGALPPMPYLVTNKHLRTVGKDCLLSFDGSLYSVPARRVRARQQVELRVSATEVLIVDPAALNSAQALLAIHPRAGVRGSWVLDPCHWDGLPDGHARAVTCEWASLEALASPEAEPSALAALLSRTRAAQVPVGRRPLTAYDLAAGQAGGGWN